MPSVLALGAALAILHAPGREVAWHGAFALLTWIFIAPIHFEDRYYLVQVAFICSRSAVVVLQRFLHSDGAFAVSISVLISAVTAIRISSAIRHFEFQKKGSEVVKQFDGVAQAVSA